MSDASWKAMERRVANLFGGRRRGPDYGGTEGGNTDIIAQGWALEVKLYARPNYQIILDAVRQAERNAKKDEIPCAIVKRKRDHDGNALVAMRLDTFMDWFGAPPEETQ